MRKLAFLMVVLTGTGLAEATNDPGGTPRVLSFADENWLTMSIGQWDPAKGWIQSTDFYAPPQPGDVISLFGVKGKLDEVLATLQTALDGTGTQVPYVPKWQVNGSYSRRLSLLPLTLTATARLISATGEGLSRSSSTRHGPLRRR